MSICSYWQSKVSFGVGIVQYYIGPVTAKSVPE